MLKSFCEYAIKLSVDPMETNLNQLFDVMGWEDNKMKTIEK